MGNIWAILFLIGAADGQAAEGPGYWVRVEEIVDGDTFWADGVKYRVVDIDTPETHKDERHGYACEAERMLGELATVQAEILLLGRKVWVKPSGIDRYDRPLVRVRHRRKEWYGETMIRMRLAKRWSGKQEDWCGKDGLQSTAR